VSETGCGKTTLVQYLAELSGHRLFVYNMSSGTDVSDLIGGFKPIDCRVLLKELFMGFLDKFRNEVPGAEKNEAYLINLHNYFIQGKMEILLKSLVQSIPRILQQLPASSSQHEWNDMLKKFSNILGSLDKIDSNLVFSFLEGNLIKALRNGDWILIDEINLATNDVLQKIVPLIEGKSLMLYEKGDLSYIHRHKDFRIVACMNPANDSGKKPLPANLAEKFTTIWMSDPSRPDVEMMVKEICPQLDEYQIS
jgi:midasin